MTGVEIFFGALALFGLASGQQAQRKAAKASAQRAQAERNISIARQRREKRNQLRRARAQRAEVVAQGIGQGGAVSRPSTAVSGAVGGIQSQYAYNLSFLDTVSAQNQAAFQASSRQRVFESKARTFGAVTSVSTSFMGAFGEEDPGKTP